MSDKDIDAKEFNELLKKMREGDMEAFAKFYEIYEKKIRNTASIFLKKEKRSYLEDVLNGLILKLREGEDRGYISNPGPWLYRAVKNYALDCVQKTSMELLTDAQKLALLPYRRDELKEVEDRLDFYTLIQDLAQDEQQIIAMKLFYEYKHKDIAKEMGLKLNTELSKYKRSLSKIVELANSRGYYLDYKTNKVVYFKRKPEHLPEGDKPGGKEDPPT